MPVIRFSIGTQSFTLSCEEGEEPHIRQLEKNVNQRYETMQRTFGSAGNQLVMAVTMLMMEEDIQKLKKNPTPPADDDKATDHAIDEARIRQEVETEICNNVASSLEQLAERIEKV